MHKCLIVCDSKLTDIGKYAACNQQNEKIPMHYSKTSRQNGLIYFNKLRFCIKKMTIGSFLSSQNHSFGARNGDEEVNWSPVTPMHNFKMLLAAFQTGQTFVRYLSQTN